MKKRITPKNKIDFGNDYDEVLDIFLSRIDKTPCGPDKSELYPTCNHNCWTYKGRLDKDGYGILSVKNYTIQAHRFAYIIYNDANLSSTDLICHICDNRQCINPNHLYLGNFKQNKKDCINRNRLNIAIGTQLPQTKLSNDEVVEILIDIYNKYKNIQEICNSYNVDYHVIYNILNGKNFKHITNKLQVPLIELKKKVVGVWQYSIKNTISEIINS